MGTFNNIMSNQIWVGQGIQPVHSPNPTEYDRQESYRAQRIRNYFDGFEGLEGGARADWEKRYLKLIKGKSPAQIDEIYRNTVFRELFKDTPYPERQKIWNNRHNMSIRQRDIYVAREITKDYAKKGGPGRGLSDIRFNRQALNLLKNEAELVSNKYRTILQSLDSTQKQSMLRDFENLSNEVSPYYKKYNNTDKLRLSDEEKLNLVAKFEAWNEIGGNSFAMKALGEYYQDTTAKNQSTWEKAINSGAQFIDSAAGMIIRAVGMAAAASLPGIISIWDSDKSFRENIGNVVDNIIDNEVTRYGDRVATTNSYDPEEQKKLEELGLSDNPILNTVAQQESLVSVNTPFELFGQYGFTAASTILSFGGSAAVNALAKGAAWASRAATGARGLNTTARGIRFLRGVSRAKDIGNFAVVGGVATVEGGMNAAQTKHDVLDRLNSDIDNRYRQKAQEDIANQVRRDPQGAARLLRAKGYDIPERISMTKEGEPQSSYSEQEVNQMIEMLQNNEDAISATMEKYAANIADDRVAAEEAAKTAMYTDFIGSSIINGFVHSTLQSTLNAPSIQNTLRKIGLGKSPLDRAGINVTNQGGRWVANAEKYGRLNAFGNRLKESLGEGLEEYKQDLSSAYAQGYAEDKYRQYLENRYAGGSMEDALDTDIVSSMEAGLRAMGEKAVSREAIKDGLYGGLSTFMGGLNVNSHILNGSTRGERREGESFLNYISRKSPIGWRSGIGPLINSSEVDAVNTKREEIAKNVNDFFSKPENQEAFFNVVGTSEWMRQMETAAENKDQMEVRNARLGTLFSNIITLNSLKGTGYYDTAIASLQARANLSEGNLQDENSEEAKLVAMYKQDALNRGQDVTDEEALQSIKSSASKMLDTIDKVNKETKEVEKLYGDELDNDVKAGLVFQRLSIEDAKNRMNQLNDELKSVEAALESEPESERVYSNATNRSSKILMARYGSLDKAQEELKRLEDEGKDLESSIRHINLGLRGEEPLTENQKEQLTFERAILQDVLNEVKREKRELKSLINNTESLSTAEIDNEGGLRATDRQIISAADIMRLDAQSRAIMLDPNNRENYSQEQQAEIDKVNRIGVQTYQDFASKIQDSSRLTFSYEASMQRQLDMMQNPQFFTREANRIKSKAQERLLRKKYYYLLDLEEQGDYTAFSRELDRINDSGDEASINAAVSLLKGNNSELFKRYNAEREGLGNLYDTLGKGQVESYNKLDDNQKSIFADTLRYLSNRGIDINNINEAVTALSEMNEDGHPQLLHYVEAVNSVTPEDRKSVFTSVEEAIQNYKDVMGEYNTALQEKENNAKETPITPTTSEQSTPPKAPSAGEASLRAHGTATIEEGTKRSQAADQEGIIEDPVTEAYKENSGQEIASLSKLATNSISNASSNTSNQESKNLALDEVRRLSDVKFDNADDYADALLQSANKLDSQSEDDGDNEGRAASLLRAAATKVRARADESKRKSEEEKAKNRAPQDRNTNLAERKFTSPIRSIVNVNAALMDTIPIAWMRQNHPNSPLVKYYDNHRIEEFLETDFMSSKPTVMFISDPQLAETVKADMESRNLEYTEDNIPLIAVVEVPTGGVTIKVNGVDKHFQPIGIMPRTGNANSNGSNRLAAIRSLINNQELGQLIKDADGNIVTTTIGGNVIAEAPKQLPATEPNRSAISLQINDLNEKEKRELQALSKPDRRKNPIYWRIKQAFLKKLAIATPEGEGKYLYYALPNLKGEVIDVRVFTTPVNLTRDRNSNRLISELFNSNEVSAALNSNSRISRAAKELRKFFEKSFDTSEMYFEADDAGNIVPTESTANKLNALSEQLTKSIGNFLSLPTRDGWKYVISPTSEVMEDGRRLFTLSLVDNEGSQIGLGKVTSGQMTENTQFSILKNLIMNGSSVRMVNNRESFVKWNVPYSDVQNMDSNKAAKDNISDIYDDGILEFSKDSLRYHIKGLSINSPFTMQGEANYTKQDEVSSPTNAQPTTPLNQPVVAANDQVTTPKGTIVDSESGAVLEGESAPPSQSSTDVKPIVDSIAANSKIIQLSEDGKYYINTRTGKKYARVTSIIQADEHSDGRFDPSNPWVTPSTNIGTGIDELVRDFFAGQKRRKTPKTPLKEEYRGKLIFAQSGSGKTSIADNKDVIDSDYLLASILGVPTPLAMSAFGLLSIAEKKKVSERYQKAIKDTVSRGKTVVTANLKLLDDADLVVYMEDVEDVNSRTNADSRSNQYINDEYQRKSYNIIQEKVKGGKKSIALKRGEYLSDVLLTDSSFNIVNAGVQSYDSIMDAVRDFMSNFGVTFDEFESRGYSIDYLDKVIKGFSTGDLVDGAGELIAFMMQYNGREKSIIAKLAVEAGDVKESEIYRNSKIVDSVYKKLNKDRYIKAIGRSISKELQAEFDEIKYGKSPRTIKDRFAEIIDIIKEFLAKIIANTELIDELSKFSKYVSYNVLADNPSLITASLRKPGDEEAGRVEKVNIDKALSEHPYELDIIRKLSSKGIMLAGSAAMATQISIYRPKENPLHDLDFATNGIMSREQLEELITPLFDNLTHIRTIDNGGPVTETYLILDRPFRIEKVGSLGTYKIIDANSGEQLGSFIGSNLHLNKGVQGKFLDFFIKQNSERAHNYSFQGDTILMADYRASMKAKLQYGRLKDLFDYNRFIKKRQYPNMTEQQQEAFVEQLQRLKNVLDSQGLTIIPRDVIATGSIEVTDSEGKKHTIDVAGTLDLLAYDGKGNFYIFDMKTHHSTNVDGKIDKWRRQLTLYKTFLESQYGINVKSLNIIPIKVEYPTPKGVGNSTNEFTVKEGNQLLLNGKEFTGANPNLGMTIALNPIELNVLFDNLTEEEKAQIRESEASQSEVGTVEKVDAKEEGDGSFIEPMTGLRKTKSKDLRRKKKGKGGAVKKPVERLTPVPAKYQWGKFEGFINEDNMPLWAEETIKNLEKAGYTEESWNQLSDEEMQHELECKGVTVPF